MDCVFYSVKSSSAIQNFFDEFSDSIFWFLDSEPSQNHYAVPWVYLDHMKRFCGKIGY